MVLAVTHHRGETYITTRENLMFRVRSGARGMWTRKATWIEFTGRNEAQFKLSHSTPCLKDPVQLEIGVVPAPPKLSPQELLERHIVATRPMVRAG